MGCNQAQQIFLGPGVRCLFELSGEVRIIPADDGVPDQSVTALCDLLFFLFGLGVFAWVSDCHSAGETVSEFDLVELFFDGLSERQPIDIGVDSGSVQNSTVSLLWCPQPYDC